MICLDSQLIAHWGEVPLLPVQDGILGPDVPGFQQTSLLELVVSVDHFGTSPVQGMVMGSRISCQGRLSGFHLSGLLCGSVFSLFGQRTPSGSHHMGPRRLLLPVGYLSGVWSFRCSSICLKGLCDWKQVRTFTGLRRIRWMDSERFWMY